MSSLRPSKPIVIDQGPAEIWVRNVAKGTTNEDLLKLFKPYNATIGSFNGGPFAMLVLPNHDIGQRAVQELKGTTLRGNKITVEFA